MKTLLLSALLVIFPSFDLNGQFIRLGLSSSPTGLLDECVIYFDSSAADAYDEGYDALKMNGSANASLYTRSITNDADLSINVLGPFVKDIEVPLIVTCNTLGWYDVCLLNINDVDPTTSIYLEDRLNSKIYDLRDTFVIPFLFSKGLNDNRFYVHFLKPLSFTITHESCVLNDGSISISNVSPDNPWDIKLFDFDGNLIKSAFGVTSNYAFIGLPGDLYSLELSNEHSTTVAIPIVIDRGVEVTSDFYIPSKERFYSHKPIKLKAAQSGSFTFNWDMGDGTTFDGDSVIEYTYELPGIYTVTLLVSDGNCSSASQQTIAIISSDIITSLHGTKPNNNQLTLYPTITKDAITAKVSNMQVNSIEIVDMLGKTVYRISATNLFVDNKPVTVNLNGISTGCYFFIVKGSNTYLMKRFSIY